MNKKKLIAVIIIIFVLFFIALKMTKKDKNKFETEELTKCTITQIVEASGTINPVNTVSVGSTVSGLIKAIYVDFNSEVKQGQILAQIDPANFEATVQQNQATIANAQANVAKFNAMIDMDRKTYTRYKNLYAKNFVAKSELDQAQSTYRADIAQRAAAQAQIRQAQAQYKTALTNLGYTRIVAPVNGTIIARKIDVGQPVAASFQAPELFTIAQDLKKMQIEVNVSEADIGKVKEGQKVIYTLDGYPDSEFHGKVTQVRISPTTVSNVVTYSVIVDVNNDDLKLKPGMTANVSIITDSKENVLCSPNSALRFSLNPNQKYKNKGIWVLVKNKPKRINIKTGISNESQTEIVSTELKEGMKIIISTIGEGKNTQRKKDSKAKKPMGMF